MMALYFFSILVRQLFSCDVIHPGANPSFIHHFIRHPPPRQMFGDSVEVYLMGIGSLIAEALNRHEKFVCNLSFQTVS